MKLTQEQLEHVIFLTEVVLDVNKRHLMPDALQILLYIAKSLHASDIQELPTDEINSIISRMERVLIAENDRLRDIHTQLQHYSERKPFG